MAPKAARYPTTWDEYEEVASPADNTNPSALVPEQALVEDDDEEDSETDLPIWEQRRSSVSNRIAAMGDLGGVNSFKSFARSWQRAAGFAEVIPRRPSFVYAQDQAGDNDNPLVGEIHYGRSLVGQLPHPHSSLLRQHLEASPPENMPINASSAYGSPRRGSARDDFRARDGKALEDELEAAPLATSPSSRSNIFSIPPLLAAPPLIGSYGSYGTMGGGFRRARASSSQSVGGRLSISNGQGTGSGDEEDDIALGEHEPILVKEIKQGDRVVLAVEGQSTLPQSIFNSINAIIGVGMLSLPLAFKMTGWIFGLIILSMTAGVTAHTSDLIARCMKYDDSVITYSDLAYISFGTRARIIVSALFTLELVAACVALVILFADSLHLLLPGLASINTWKCVCAGLVLVLNLMPLRWLSYTSVIGIFSTFCIVLIVMMDGIIKPEAPGSLWEPATTYLLPSNWLALPLAYGLLASPWGAHSVFPSIYRDMRHPYKWKSAVKVTFSFSYVLDTSLAVIGVLMFGDNIKDAITSNILKNKGYPKALTILMCMFIAIIPLTKIPLNARPMITTADVICGVHQDQLQERQYHHQDEDNNPDQTQRRSSTITNIIRALIRFSIVLLLLSIAIVFPAFDSVCAFLGAALCTLVSIILPISFYLKLYWKDISWNEKVRLFITLVIFSILGSIGTVWTFLPKELIGA